ncbi:polymorphic toxin-type HINT domain-containing protein [Streptacidiphilus sp. MAP5-3]|uniref:polymorphic toxin-type HINT domain-containing protein n=1 Tax=unclassified Streptacidiphilus TaxID=2643834 RepID=UPI0035171C89
MNSGNTAAHRAGTLPVWLSSTVGATDTVSVLPQSAARAAGINGVLLTLRATKRHASHVTLGYGSFADAFGGDWASRLRLVELPACAVTTPQLPACRIQTPLASTDAVKSQQVSANIALPPAAAGVKPPSTGVHAAATMAGAAVAAPMVVLAADSSSGGGGGDFTATSLKPSGSWQAGGSSDAFTWSYPISTPSVPGGLGPKLSLDYDSQSLDGLTSSTNNQASVVGDGFSMAEGFVERSYQSCHQNPAGATQTWDNCWSSDNQLTLSLNGQTTTLVKDDTTGVYHPENDTNEKVSYLTGASNGAQNGEYWQVTTADGTQYTFGLNKLPGWAAGDATTDSVLTEPVYSTASGQGCYNATFANSWCQEAYRWMLDYVKDARGDTMSYFYTPDTAYYAADLGKTATTPYTRDVSLSKIEYGQRDGSVYSTSPAGQVLFTYNGRCNTSSTGCATSTLTTSTASSWPDVPYDQYCASGASCSVQSPTFWSENELTGIQTQALVGTTETNVDSWAMTYSFPATGDSTTPSLWLSSIIRTGQDTSAGGSTSSIPMPPVTFSGTPLANRVNLSDGYPPITRYRLNTITTESGEVISVGYSAPACGTSTPSDPSQNTTLCYPDYWTPTGQQSPVEDWFNKYIVTGVTEQDPTGGGVNDTIATTYTPIGNPAWHYDDNPLTPSNNRTWDQWRGFQGMKVTTGTSPDPVTETDSYYFRGMDGDTLPNGAKRSVTVTDTRGDPAVTDSNQYAGMPYETVVYDGSGSGKVVTDTVNDPWTSAATASHTTTVSGLPAQQAFHTGTADTKVYTPLASGATRETETDYTHDSYGRVTKTNDLGDVSTSADDLCTTTTYDDNTSAWILDTPDETQTVSVNCPTTPTLPADAVSDTRTYYDGSSTFGAAPTVGDATMTQDVTAYTGSTPTWTTMATIATRDEYGRPTSTTDPDARKTTISYTPATGAAPTSITTVDPLAHDTVSNFDPLRGLLTSTTDAGGYVTSAQYDALGRTTAVFKPGITAALSKYSYTVSNSAPSVVTTSALNNDGTTYRVAETLYDAMLRQRETQTSTEDGGRDVTDSVYNTLGQVAKTTAPYYTTGAPTSTLVQAQDGQVPSETGYSYDGAGRKTAATAYGLGTQTWQTTYIYGGNFTTTVPPAGGTVQTVITDARGHTTDLYQYHAGVPADPVNDPASDYSDTHYTYTPAGQQAGETDAAGNTWTWSYNLLGQQTTATDPDTGSTSSTYDNAGQLLSSTNGDGGQTSYTYDLDGRRTAAYDTTGGAGQSTSDEIGAWTYDTLKKGYPTSTISYQKGTTSPSETSAVLGYDSFAEPAATKITLANLPTNEAALAPTGGYTTSYEYNSVGNLITQQDPAAGGLPSENIDYGYDNYGQQTSVTGTGGASWDYASAIGYDEFGHVAQYTMGPSTNWVDLTLAYDPQTNAVTGAQTTDSTSKTVVDNTTYTYGNNAVSKGAGLLTSTTDSQNGGGVTDTQCFTYTAQQQLSQAWTATDNCAATPAVGSSSTVGGPSPYWQSWTYTADGQRSTQTDYDTSGNTANDTTTTYNYPAGGSSTDQPHTLTSTTATGPAASADTANYTYDAAGNTSSISGGAAGEQSMVWNDQGKLASDTTASGSTTYLYATSGNLILRTDPGNATLFLGDTQIVETLTGSALTATRYYTANGTVIAERSNTGDVQYLIPNRQGTDTLAIDSTTQATTRRQYTPFGQTRGTAPTTWPGDDGYVGGTTDPATNLENLGAREYDPADGRFISADPILETTGPTQLSGYDYSGNDPVTGSDPAGLMYYEDGIGAGSAQALEHQLAEIAAAAKAAAAPPVYVRISPTVFVQDDGSGLVAHLQKLWTIQYKKDFGWLEGGPRNLTPLDDADIWNGICDSNAGLCDSTIKAILQNQHFRTAGMETGSPGAGDSTLLFGTCGFTGGCNGQSHGIALTPVGRLSVAGQTFEITAGECMNSFSPDTRVLMADGKSKPIASIEVGDRVKSADPTTGKPQGSRTVQAVLIHDDSNLLTVETRDAHGRVAALKTTTEHPFWDPTEHLWVDAGQLQAGESLEASSPGQVTVVSVHATPGSADRFNLTVAQLHTYYVEAGSVYVLVHNAKCKNGAAPPGEMTLYRFRSGPETTDALQENAAAAAATADGASEAGANFPFGISVSSGLPSGFKASGDYRVTTVQELLDAGFTVIKTGKNGSHYTVGLPDPVTDETTDMLNEIFGEPMSK